MVAVEQVQTGADYKLTTKQNISASMTTQGGLIPHNLDQLWQLAVIMSKSGMMPKGIQTTEAVCVAVQMGLEVGLSPMQAVQNIAVINGRPSLWGDAGLALVEASGKLEDFRETITEDNGTITATCWAKRKERPTPVERTFTTMDAKQAGLLGKDGPWKLYPKRMTQMRARWWVLRDLFSDVLKGLKAAEEVHDYIDVTPERPALTLKAEGTPESDPYKVKEPPSPATEQGKAETSASPEAKDTANPEIVDPGPAQEGEKRRGRPAGSTNKPKEPLQPDQDHEPEKENDKQDPDAVAFMTESLQYKDTLPDAEWKKLLQAFQINDPRGVKPTMRAAFLRTAKTRLEKSLEK